MFVFFIHGYMAFFRLFNARKAVEPIMLHSTEIDEHFTFVKRDVMQSVFIP